MKLPALAEGERASLRLAATHRRRAAAVKSRGARYGARTVPETLPRLRGRATRKKPECVRQNERRRRVLISRRSRAIVRAAVSMDLSGPLFTAAPGMTTGLVFLHALPYNVEAFLKKSFTKKLYARLARPAPQLPHATPPRLVYPSSPHGERPARPEWRQR